MTGLRERKKRETADRIANAAAELFADRGFEAVAVVDVARAADVSEQTVYNHFPTKEDLVFDRSEEVQNAVAEAVRSRAPGIPAADAVGVVAHALLDGVAEAPTDAPRGGMPKLAASSPVLSRAALDHTRRLADRLADVLRRQGEPDAEAEIAGWSLAGLVQLLIEDLGRAQQGGDDPAVIAARLRAPLDARLRRLRRL